ncbi:MAG: C factor, cell signaling protein, partial [Paracoccaceae bacterium]
MNSILLIGNSGGIGHALQGALEARGASVTGLSRRDTGLDLNDEASIEGQLSALSGPFDAILVASGALEINGARPEKALSQLTQSAFLDQFIVNAAGPALILKHAPRLLPKDRPSQFAALSARVGSIGDNKIGGWYSYRAAKAALNQIIHTGAIELART